MKTKNNTQTKSILAALAGLTLAVCSVQAATPIPILNAGFEDVTGPLPRGNFSTLTDWTEENAATVFVDNNGTAWVPEASKTLYFGPGAVHQDLSHNWSIGDSFTLEMIAMNPSWSDNNNTLKVQLRQASDGTVLWDSGDQNVGGTVTTTAPAYTGTGHILSWNIDASTFTAGTEGEQINIRIAHVSGGPVYADNVSLEVAVAAIPEPSSTALLGLGGLALLLRRRE